MFLSTVSTTWSSCPWVFVIITCNLISHNIFVVDDGRLFVCLFVFCLCVYVCGGGDRFYYMLIQDVVKGMHLDNLCSVCLHSWCYEEVPGM